MTPACSVRPGTARRRCRRRARPRTGAYINCPFTREEYETFLDALIAADQHHGHEFDAVPYFEGCMPAEEMAKRGRETLRFGPMKPVGLRDPRTGREAYAVAQLAWRTAPAHVESRRLSDTAAHPEQQRVFRMIPGLRTPNFCATAPFTGTRT
jgi:methylenetetrahydrofolate--tRNA-(uracil-5-)-methyltransferase